MKIHDLLLQGYEILKRSEIDSYIIDCQLLLSKVLNMDRLFIITHREIDVDEEKSSEYLELVKSRGNKMPIKYILGETEFMGINFSVKPGVLIPRPDTEILVEEVLRLIDLKGYKSICDVCCGSGAIGLSIGEINKDTKVECYDVSQVACSVTEENIKKNGLNSRVKVYESDLLQEAIKAEKKFDVIVSNPPYIKASVIPTLMEDVKNYEPYIALSGGEDGLEFYRKITEQSLSVLIPGGLLAFEIGHDQEQEVTNILKQQDFVDISSKRDLSGNPRVVTAMKP